MTTTPYEVSQDAVADQHLGVSELRCRRGDVLRLKGHAQELPGLWGELGPRNGKLIVCEKAEVDPVLPLDQEGEELVEPAPGEDQDPGGVRVERLHEPRALLALDRALGEELERRLSIPLPKMMARLLRYLLLTKSDCWASVSKQFPSSPRGMIIRRDTSLRRPVASSETHWVTPRARQVLRMPQSVTSALWDRD